MYCEKCGTQLPDNAGFCLSCGKPTSNAVQSAQVAPAKGKTSRLSLVLFMVLLLFVVIGLALKYGRDQRVSKDSDTGSLTPANPVSAPLPLMHHQQKLLSGSVAVNAHSFYWIAFALASNMQNVQVSGHFQTYGGKQNDIQAVICSDQEFVNLRNGHHARVFYDSGKTTVADISAKLPGSDGKYILAFNNNFSLLSGKTVNVEVTLNYDTY